MMEWKICRPQDLEHRALLHLVNNFQQIISLFYKQFVFSPSIVLTSEFVLTKSELKSSSRLRNHTVISNVGSSKNLGRATFRKMPEAPSLARVWVGYFGFCGGGGSNPPPPSRLCMSNIPHHAIKKSIRNSQHCITVSSPHVCLGGGLEGPVAYIYTL